MASGSIGRLQAALASATNDITVAAANLNFDFSLVKYEAPKEYRQLGELLSTRRKQDAETGKSHITARRIAALFEGACPPTPNLVRAYGERVSEISQKATDKVSKQYSSSLFADYAGVDATSIWAAATSSKDAQGGAIQVHLLACLLASMWDPPEAISIWVELVKERRQKIALDLENGASIPFSLAAAAAQQEISRTQLAEWDASARSWIATADDVMVKKQTQLKLILKNVDLAITNHDGVYPSVLAVWRTTLTVVERLVSGMPQEVQDGTALLGLLAWHLYPDIHAFGPKIVEVRMEDPLISPGGILSVGCSPSATTPASGITWSLSLAHLQYYGSPVQRNAVVEQDPSRLSSSELRQVALGCLLGLWNVSLGQQSIALKLIHTLAAGIRSYAGMPGISPSLPSCFEYIGNGVEDFWADEDAGLKLLSLGRKRPNFLPQYAQIGSVRMRPKPFFGLIDVQAFLACLKDVEARVAYLRRVGARQPDLEQRQPIIRYDYSVRSPGKGTGDPSVEAAEFATVFPASIPNPDDSDLPPKARYHTRWRHRHSRKDTRAIGGNEQLISNDNCEAFDNISFANFVRVGDYGTKIGYSFFFGDSQVAIFLPDATSASASDRPPTSAPKVPQVQIEDVLLALKYCLFDLRALLRSMPNCVMNALHALNLSMAAFDKLSGAVIRTRTLAKNVQEAKWYNDVIVQGKDNSALNMRPLDISTQFSVLAYFVAGCDISAAEIPDNVMGISVDDSIYVPNTLLEDPLGSLEPPHLVHILGNIGQPGAVLFSSVKKPVVPPLDESNWRIANSRSFDAQAEDNLISTSLHLSFTPWQLSLQKVEDQGNQDPQFTKMEAVISVREAGKWIGDVDIMTALRSPRIYRMPGQAACQHRPEEPPDIYMSSLECWDEIRDMPAGAAVVRAHGNKIARLAVVSFLGQCADQAPFEISRITVCPESVCWRCIEDETRSTKSIYVY